MSSVFSKEESSLIDSIKWKERHAEEAQNVLDEYVSKLARAQAIVKDTQDNIVRQTQALNLIEDTLRDYREQLRKFMGFPDSPTAMLVSPTFVSANPEDPLNALESRSNVEKPNASSISQSSAG